MKAVFFKELKSYFKNPLGYIFIGMMLVIMGFYYAFYAMYYRYADYYHVLNACTSLILFIFPVLTMRIMSEEMKNRTDQILLTSPIKTSGVVVGKFLAAEAVFLVVIALSLLQPMTTIFIFKGQMTPGMTAGGYLAFFLLGTACIAIGMFISSLTENQLIAAVISIAVFMLLSLTEGIYNVIPTSRYMSLGVLVFVLLLVLLLIYYAIHDMVVTGIVGAAVLLGILGAFFVWPTAFDGLIGNIVKNLSMFQRYSDMFSGVFDFDHILYFLSVAVFFLFLTYQVVEKKRWS